MGIIISITLWCSLWYTSAYNTGTNTGTGRILTPPLAGASVISWSTTTTWSTATISTSWTVLSWTTTGLTTTMSQSIINVAIWWLGIPEDPEFIEALARMHNNDLTSYGSPSTYRPFDKITREESAKIFGRFARNILSMGFKPEIADTFCIFADSGFIADTLRKDVFDACKLGIFRWGNGGFYPKWWLTKAQSIVVLIRLFDNQILSESSTPWFKNYYNRAFELGITKDKDLTNFDREVTRYEIALMMYRFNIKYKLLKKNNGIVLSPDQFMGTISWSEISINELTGANGLKKATVLFNATILSDPSIDSFDITLFGSKYIIKKREMNNYWVWNTNYVQFCDLFAADGTTFLGTATFTVLNGLIEDAYIRPSELSNKYIYIKPSVQQPYYTIEEKIS